LRLPIAYCIGENSVGTQSFVSNICTMGAICPIVSRHSLAPRAASRTKI